MTEHPTPEQRAPRDPAEQPVLDEDGLLRFGGRWVAVPDSLLPMADLLVRHHGHLVRHRDLQEAYVRGGGGRNEGSLRTAIHRMRKRTEVVGLALHVVRGRGALLEPVRPDR